MEAEALKIILDLQKENTLLHRAINEACIMLHKRKKHSVPKYGDEDISFLFSEIYDIIDKLPAM